jgi:hypothetical protein
MMAVSLTKPLFPLLGARRIGRRVRIDAPSHDIGGVEANVKAALPARIGIGREVL